MTEPGLIDVRNLKVVFSVGGRDVVAVDDLNLSIARGETVALVGESGSGKSVSSLAIMGLLPRRIARIAGGRIPFRGRDHTERDLVTLSAEEKRQIRGNEIGMVFQEPMTSLNPVYTVGEQIAEPIRIHRGAPRHEAAERAIALLDRVGIPDPTRRARQYPHELSGGMRQRVTIAMALACDPLLLIADEPTTALDVTIQAQILDLLRELKAERSMGVLFITHNLGVVADIADRVAVMYCGRIVETGPVAEVFGHPRYPYTRGLLRSVPRLGEATKLKKNGTPLLAIAGTVPSLERMPSGCPFAPRCDLALEACREVVPVLAETGAGHWSRCIRFGEL
jgi:peptide/nickel transport system ATP-binding protein